MPDEQLWESYAYFLERVVPVAERAGVRMALHPDDPPISPIRGIARIFRSVDPMARAIELVPSAHHGITFCQGTFATMGADIPTAIRSFGERKTVHRERPQGTPGFSPEGNEASADEAGAEVRMKSVVVQ